MRISAKGEYAIQAVLDLALHDGSGLQPIQGIAARRLIPQRYLEQVLLQLKRAGLLASKRGSSGGYRLSRPPREITVGEVLRAVEGSLPGGAVPRRAAAAADPALDLSDLWHEIASAVARVTDCVTFEDLRRRAQDRRSAARPMYHI